MLALAQSPTCLALNAAHRARQARLEAARYVPKPAVVAQTVTPINPWSDIDQQFKLAHQTIDRAVASASLIEIGNIPVHKIQKAVCAAYGIEIMDLKSTRRTADIVRPRQIAMYLAKTLTPHSLPAIGRLFYRDHTTVLYAVRKINRLIATDGALQQELDALIEKIVA